MYKKKRLWMGLSSICIFLLVLSFVGDALGRQYEGAINNFLGIATSRVLNPGDPDYPDDSVEVTDTEYFKSDYGERTEENQKKLVEDSFEQIIAEEREGAALLYNKDNALPLSKDERISFFGHASVDPVVRGSSAGQDPMEGYRINFPTAMKAAGFEVNEELTAALEDSPITRGKDDFWWMDSSITTHGIADGEEDISFYTDDLKKSWRDYQGGTAIMTIARCGQEEYDMQVDNLGTGRSAMALIDEEIDLLNMLKEEKAAGYFDKIIVLVNTGSPLEVGWLDEYDVDACMYVGPIGAQGAHGVVQLLSGEANPSGHLVDTFAVDSLSSPAVVNANGNTPEYLNGDEVEAAVMGKTDPREGTGKYMSFQAEGIYVGYKYYETRYEDTVYEQGGASDPVGASGGASQWNYADEVSYPFGYGLSYTTFDQSLDKVEWNADEDKYEVTVTVTNTGDVAGKSVVQVYAQTPYGDYEKENKVEKSAIQIVGFDKTDLLDPGESQTLTIDVDRYFLASYDYVNAKGYILSEGDYYLAIGDNAHDALNNVIMAKGVSPEEEARMTGPGNADKVYRFQNELDTETYRVSETGTEVTNQFEDCDLNYWIEGAGTYLSRSDWSGTYPVEPTRVEATPEMIEILAGHMHTKPDEASTVAEATEELGTDAGLKLVDMKDVPYADETWDAFIGQMTLDEMLLMLDDSQGNSAAVIERLGIPAMSLGDGVNGPNGCTLPFPYTADEGSIYGSGTVENARMACFAGKPILTGTFNRDLYKERGRLIGEMGLWADKQEFWTLGTNLHRTPFGGRNFEYCSEDANMCYMVLIPEAKEIEKRGVIVCAKHPAGNDQETARIGVSVFFNEQAWREGSLRASEGALREAGIHAFMQSYERLGLRSTMNSSAFNQTVVQDEWGFRGNIITDCTNGKLDGYQGDYIDQLAAGTDRFCMTNGTVAMDAVKKYLDETDDGDFVQYIKRAAKNYCYEFSRSNMINGLSGDAIVETIVPWWETAVRTMLIGFAVLSAAGIVLLTASKVKERKEEQKHEDDHR